jgi:hypothetical protein
MPLFVQRNKCGHAALVSSMIELNQDLIIGLEFHVVFMVLLIAFGKITFLVETAPRVV